MAARECLLFKHCLSEKQARLWEKRGFDRDLSQVSTNLRGITIALNLKHGRVFDHKQAMIHRAVRLDC